MGWDVSFTIHCECDRCNHSEDYDVDEPMSDAAVEIYIADEGWTYKDGEMLCEDCASETEDVDAFTDKCLSCWHYCARHCPQYKMSCERVYEEHYSFKDDPVCEFFMPIGGKKDNTPKYKPTDASLDTFVSTKEVIE